MSSLSETWKRLDIPTIQRGKYKNNLRRWCLKSIVVLCKIIRCLDLTSLHSFISGYIRNRWNLLYAATNLTTHNIWSLPVFTTFSPNSKDSTHTQFMWSFYALITSEHHTRKYTQNSERNYINTISTSTEWRPNIKS